MTPEDCKDPKVVKTALYWFLLMLAMLLGALAIVIMLVKAS